MGGSGIWTHYPGGTHYPGVTITMLYQLSYNRSPYWLASQSCWVASRIYILCSSLNGCWRIQFELYSTLNGQDYLFVDNEKYNFTGSAPFWSNACTIKSNQCFVTCAKYIWCRLTALSALSLFRTSRTLSSFTLLSSAACLTVAIWFVYMLSKINRVVMSRKVQNKKQRKFLKLHTFV